VKELAFGRAVLGCTPQRGARQDSGQETSLAAQKFINFVYDPKVQADIAEYINYVTPVRGVKAILAKRDPALAKSPLIFPSERYTADCSFEPVLGGELGQEVTDAFQRAIGN
jgi:spermidine/putrescine transport system substrate-binding protein